MKKNYFNQKKFDGYLNLNRFELTKTSTITYSDIQNKLKKLVSIFLMLIITNFVMANSITLNSLSSSHGCSGTSVPITITFTKTGTFFTGNIFIAQLSDSSGSFAIPLDIGSVTSIVAVPIIATIPAGIATGSGYLIRVISSDNNNSQNQFHVTISKNSIGFSVSSTITSSVSIAITSGSNPACAGTSITFTASPVNEGSAPTYQWQINGINAGTNSSLFTTSGLTNGNTVNCILTSSETCASPSSASSNSITMGINPLPSLPGGISGPKIVCGLSSATYYIASVTGATSYDWTIPSGMTVASGFGTRIISVNIDGSFTSGTISVAAVNGCGAGALRTAAVSILPNIPGSVTGPAMVCGLSSATYSVTATSGIISYDWIVPAGVTIVSGSGTRIISVNIDGSFISGTISVAAINTCGTGAPRNFALYTIPKVPGSISGPSMLCGLSSATFSIASVTGAISYNWTVPSGISIVSGQGTTNLSVNIDNTFVSGSISVLATNTCGSSALKMKAVYTKPVPGVISGPAMVCGMFSATYSIATVTGATSYNWTVPTGISIVSGQGTTSVSVNIAPTFISGFISVASINTCGTSALRSLAIYTKPKVPGAITGPANVCGLSSATYTIAAVIGATSYNWVTPAGMSVSSGLGTDSIVVNIDPTFDSGHITVAAVNGCGTGTARSLILTSCRNSNASILPNASKDINSDFSFSIYPNPNDGFAFNLQITAETFQDVLITLYDITGKENYSETIVTGENGNNIFSFDLSNKLSSGVYIVTATSNEKTYRKKFIVK